MNLVSRSACFFNLALVFMGVQKGLAEIPSLTPDWAARQKHDQTAVKSWQERIQARRTLLEEDLVLLDQGRWPPLRPGLSNTHYAEWGYHQVWLPPDRRAALVHLSAMAGGTTFDPAVSPERTFYRFMKSHLELISDQEYGAHREQLLSLTGKIDPFSGANPVAFARTKEGKGLRVLSVKSGHPLSKLVFQGDVLLAIERQPINTLEAYWAALQQFSGSPSLKWTLQRGNPSATLTVLVPIEPGSLPVASGEGFKTLRQGYVGRLQSLSLDAARLAQMESRLQSSLEAYIAGQRPVLEVAGAYINFKVWGKADPVQVGYSDGQRMAPAFVTSTQASDVQGALRALEQLYQSSPRDDKSPEHLVRLEQIREAATYLTQHPEEWDKAVLQRDKKLHESPPVSVPSSKVILGVGFDALNSTLTGSRDGLEVSMVIPKGPAERAGIKKGDRVLSIERNPVSSRLTLVEALNQFEPGATVLVGIRRGPATLTLRAKLDQAR